MMTDINRLHSSGKFQKAPSQKAPLNCAKISLEFADSRTRTSLGLCQTFN